MLLTPALGYLGVRTLDGFARYSKSKPSQNVCGAEMTDEIDRHQ